MTYYLQGSSDDFLGEARGKPSVQWIREKSSMPEAKVSKDQMSFQPFPPVDPESVHLNWLPIYRLGKHQGDVLAAFELVLDKEPWRATFRGPKSERGYFQIPPVIAPVLKRHTIEVNT